MPNLKSLIERAQKQLACQPPPIKKYTPEMEENLTRAVRLFCRVGFQEPEWLRSLVARMESGAMTDLDHALVAEIPMPVAYGFTPLSLVKMLIELDDEV